jgi:transcriptional regulator with XRE-family HTH domain
MVGENIRWARKLRGMTQEQLAKAIRVHRHPTTRSYISRLESGAIDPRVSTLLSIARALKVRPSLLVTRVGEGEEFLEVYLSLTPGQKRNLRAIVRMWRSRV